MGENFWAGTSAWISALTSAGYPAPKLYVYAPFRFLTEATLPFNRWPLRTDRPFSCSALQDITTPDSLRFTGTWCPRPSSASGGHSMLHGWRLELNLFRCTVATKTFPALHPKLGRALETNVLLLQCCYLPALQKTSMNFCFEVAWGFDTEKWCFLGGEFCMVSASQETKPENPSKTQGKIRSIFR